VARHLVAAGRLVDEDPQLALEHARFARRRASRIAVVREAAGIAAYHAGEWAEALAELRAARRMGGGPVHVPVMADIERALGRPERAIDLARGPEARELDRAERIELTIVAAGARRDMGETEASVVALQIPELDPARRDPWSARLFYAYADNLLAAGRESDAVQWFVHAADADQQGETDAAERIAAVTGDDSADLDLDDIAFGEEDAPEPPSPPRADRPGAGEPSAGPQDGATIGSDPGEGVAGDDIEVPAAVGSGADGGTADEDVSDEVRAVADDVIELVATDTVGENDVAENDVAENDVAENDVAENDVAENDVAENDVAENDVAENDVAENDVAENDVAENDVAENDVAENDVAENDVAENDVAENDVAENDVAPGADGGSGR
jgi:hypothetical protein